MSISAFQCRIISCNNNIYSGILLFTKNFTTVLIILKDCGLRTFSTKVSQMLFIKDSIYYDVYIWTNIIFPISIIVKYLFNCMLKLMKHLNHRQWCDLCVQYLKRFVHIIIRTCTSKSFHQTFVSVAFIVIMNIL